MEVADEMPDSALSNCSVALVWHNASEALPLPVVTNHTIAVHVRVHGFAVLGIKIRRPGVVASVIIYALVNILATSVIPIPIATTLVPVATLLFGIGPGMAINLVTTCIGAMSACFLIRCGCRPLFIRFLGRHRRKWLAIDEALLKHGWQIPLLIRCSPVSPVVLTNIMLSLTSISQRTYLWTTFIGEVVTSLPYAYAAHIGSTLASNSERGRDPLMLIASTVGFLATVLITWRIGGIAKALVEERSDLREYEKAEAEADDDGT